MEYVTWEGLFTFVMCMAAVMGVFCHWAKKNSPRQKRGEEIMIQNRPV